MEIKNVIRLLSMDERMKEDMKALILQCYDDQTFRIGKLFEVVRSDLISKGIEVPELQKLYNLFYAVKNDLERDGLIKQVKYGTYYVNSAGVNDEVTEESTIPEEDDEEEEIPEDDEDKVDENVPVYGNGESTVYAYFYPSYKKLAELKGESRYRCKIGKTTNGVKRRFSSTSRTEEPEKKEVALIIKTDSPNEVEALLHNTLKLAGQQVLDTPGKEWFYTNPEEIIHIFYGIANLFESDDVYHEEMLFD